MPTIGVLLWIGLVTVDVMYLVTRLVSWAFGLEGLYGLDFSFEPLAIYNLMVNGQRKTEMREIRNLLFLLNRLQLNGTNA